MNSRLLLVAGLSAGAVFTAACGGSTGGGLYGSAPSPKPTTAPSVAPVAASPSPTTAPVASGTTISVAGSRFGQILVGPNGRTLYLFVADKGTASTCNSPACVQYWPPLLTKGAPQAGSGVNASLLGTTVRSDGSTEVTYAGHPLYYFLSDSKPGDVTGQGIDAFGGPWYVVSPSGTQIR